MYRRDIAAYQQWACQQALDVMNPQTLRLWRDWMLSQTRMSSNTINRMLAAVKRVMQEARRRDLLDELTYARFQSVEGVRIDPHRLKPHARTRISAADMRRLCAAPGTATLVRLRDTAMLHTLATSGLRARELTTAGQKFEAPSAPITGGHTIVPGYSLSYAAMPPLKRAASLCSSCSTV